ncbi:MAG: DUF4129 domain-containing protein [Pseudomonadota bacterium]
MRRLGALVLLLVGVWAPVGPSAQERITYLEPPRDEAYRDAVRWRGLQHEIRYVDELDGEIPLDGSDLPEPPRPTTEAPDGALTAAEVTGRTLLIAVLIGALALAVLKGGAAARLFGSPGARRARPMPSEPDTESEELSQIPPSDLARIRAMPDRRAALIALLHLTLSAAARQNGLRLRRAETARDFLRRLPRGWGGLAALRQIVMAEELVQFGGRPVSADSLETCIASAERILSGARAPGTA